MERLDFEELDSRVGDVGRAVERTPGADAFCSRLDWTLPFHRAFGRKRPLWVHAEAGSFVALARARHTRIGAYLEPLEAMWGFACPLLGPSAVDLLWRALQAPEANARGLPLLLMGLPMRGPLIDALVSRLSAPYSGRVIDTTERYVASLEGGLEAFLSRRSSTFRRNLRSAERRCRDSGLRFERLRPGAAQTPELYQRVLAIERASWKAACGRGVDRGPMADFYREMWPRLARRDALRLIVARKGEREVGYLHGGVIGKRFRGLQFSFDQRVSELSLGNVLQLEMIRWLCEEAFQQYDLGSGASYKARWAEGREVSCALFVTPR